MRVNLLFKAFSFILMNTLVLAKEQEDCQEIKSYFSGNEELYKNTIEECVEKDGKVIELIVNKNQELSDEILKKILSNNTIKTLKYVVKTDDNSFPNLSKLTELENLHFSSGMPQASAGGAKTFRSVDMDNDNFDTIPNTLKELKLSSVHISQKNAKKIDSLENLENLEINGIFLDESDFTDLSNRGKLTELTMSSNFPKNIFKTKSLIILSLSSVVLSEKEIEEISSLPNIEELYITGVTDEDGNNIDFDLSNLNTLSSLYLGYITPYYPSSIQPYNMNYKFPENLKELTITFRTLTAENLNHISSLNSLEKLTFSKCKFDVKDLETLKNLNNLSSLTMNADNLKEIPEFIYSLNGLKALNLSVNSLTTIPDKLGTLENLEQIIFIGNEITDVSKELSNLPKLEKIVLKNNAISIIPEELFNISSLKYLDLGSNQIKSISDNIGKLTELKTLKLYGNHLTEFPKNIAKLKNLEILDLSINDIDDEMPESYNDLPVLKEIELWDNKNIKGKTLTNESLTKCLYHRNFNDYYNDSEYSKLYNQCKNVEEYGGACLNTNYDNVKYDSLCRGNEKCLQEGDLSDLKICPESSTTSSNGKCGTEDGKCPSDQCCSKYGWCGKTDDYCSASKGCQSEFGKCNDDTNTTTTTPTNISTNGKCGTEDGRCPSGQCCSKYGWCGKSDDYCSASKGCQIEFGKCDGDATTTTTNTSTNDKCGKEYGKCPSGKCCSKYGWCGKTDDHCSVSKGCQSEFGKCDGITTTTITTTTTLPSNYKCGKEYGKCPSGKCCSKYGWCGKTDDHCSVSKGCQSEFGTCSNNSLPVEGKCGEGYGKCPSGQCCSKYGWCGKTDDYCSISKGCKSEFGICN